jgi:hypothetical protein
MPVSLSSLVKSKAETEVYVGEHRFKMRALSMAEVRRVENLLPPAPEEPERGADEAERKAFQLAAGEWGDDIESAHVALACDFEHNGTTLARLFAEGDDDAALAWLGSFKAALLEVLTSHQFRTITRKLREMTFPNSAAATENASGN